MEIPLKNQMEKNMIPKTSSWELGSMDSDVSDLFKPESRNFNSQPGHILASSTFRADLLRTG